MKKQFSFLFALIMFASTVFAQNMGKSMEGKIVKSVIMGKDVKYTIYLPAGYETSER